MQLTKALCCIIIVLLAQAFKQEAFSQTVNAQLTVGESFNLHSTILKEDRTILIYWPDGYFESDVTYPVLYLIDGDSHLMHVGGSVNFLSSPAIGYMPKIIIVGIANTDRARDLTPAPHHGIEKDFPSGGGADKFLSFISTELKPVIKFKYRTAPFEILAGTSLGGLFTVYTFITHPEAFNAYFAISPSLWWDENEIPLKAVSILKKPVTENKFLYLSLCKGDSKSLQDGTQQFESILKSRSVDSLHWQFKFLNDETHNSVPHQAFYQALKFLYNDWQLGVVGNVTDLENHYSRLSRKYGYTIEVPEGEMNSLGYQLLFVGKINEAIAVFARNVEKFPASANVYDSMGDAYRAAGKLELAKDSYEKAYEIGKRTNNINVTSYYNNLNSVIKMLNDK